MTKPQSATIHDRVTGGSAEVLVGRGFNCFRFTAMVMGQPLEVLYAPPDFEAGEGRPSRGGIPLLFPFPGRISGTEFTWKGKRYSLEAGDALGNAIHGFVLSRPWRVIEQEKNRIVGEFQASQDDPSLQARWPSDFRITATYELDDNVLTADYRMENTGEEPLPCGFGSHPYFRVPLATGVAKAGGADDQSRQAEECVVRLPVSTRWELENMLPTGRRLDLANAAALQAGQKFGELKLDDVFAGLKFANGWCTASIHDPASGRTVTQRFGDTFRECVVFTPPHREAICIEPYTCVPGCLELANKGIVAGLRILKPGGSFTGRVEIIVS